ncbi:MAG: hypothetical protein JJT94_10970 [Bernardetiaceae bacterium]|nr:hypothetical protein [Bernardetiaceae bacterium]
MQTQDTDFLIAVPSKLLALHTKEDIKNFLEKQLAIEALKLEGQHSSNLLAAVREVDWENEFVPVPQAEYEAIDKKYGF